MKVYNPYRSKYNHKYTNEICPFCNASIIHKQNIKKLESKYWRVFVNFFPILDGNVMIISKRHLEDTSKINLKEWKDLKIVIENTKDLLKKALNIDSFNIGINLGVNSGASVKHLHIQVIPRSEKQTKPAIAELIANLHVVKLSPSKLKKLLDSDDSLL